MHGAALVLITAFAIANLVALVATALFAHIADALGCRRWGRWR